MRIRVTRVLVLEGEADWIEQTLAKSWVAPDRPQVLPVQASITEVSRTREELP